MARRQRARQPRGRCFCDRSAERFRDWLRDRHGDARGAQRRLGHVLLVASATRDWDEVLPPRATPTFPNPGQGLDWRRFCSDELLGQYLAERAVLREHPDGR